MFNSQLLDTAIGLAFIYFFLSLLCSVIIESVTGLTKKRPRMLRDGILSLLQDETVVSKLYEQPLFMGKSLPGGVFKSLGQNFIRISSQKTDEGKKESQAKQVVPSYISSRTFVLSLLESLKQHPDVLKKLLNDQISSLSDKLKIEYFRNNLSSLPDGDKIKDELLSSVREAESDAAKAPSAIKTCCDRLVSQPDILIRILKETKKFPAIDSVAHIKDLVNSLSDDSAIKKALIPLLETVLDSAPVDKALESMEKWYDEAMQRVTGWYKRYSQAFCLILAFVVALMLNADTFQIGKAIYRDQALRASLVKMAEKAGEQPPSAGKQSSQSEQPKPVETSLSSGQEKPEKGKQGEVSKPPSIDLENVDWNKVSEMYKQISSLNLPIGWPVKQEKEGWLVKLGFSRQPDMADLGLVKLLGIFLTALMVSLGSNFWFELLNKLLNMRNAGKKPLTKEEQDAQKK